MQINKNQGSDNIPALRFPEFKGEWEKKKLLEICKMQAGKFISATEIKDMYYENLYPCYGGNGLRGYTLTFNQFGKYSLIGRQGAHCGNVKLVEGKFYATEHALVVNLFEGFDTDFTYYILINSNLNQYSTGQAQPGLSVQSLDKVESFIPTTLLEQQKIASFFTAIDKKIQDLQQKKQLLQQYKKGIMQQLFTQQLRFKDDNGKDYPDWEEKKLGEVYSFKITNSFSREQLNYEEGEVKNIHYGDIHTKFQTLFDITKEKVPFINISTPITRIVEDNYCKEGDIILADASEDLNDVGKSIEVVNLNNEKILSGLHTILARPNLDLLSIGFGGYLFKSDLVRTQIQKESQGSKVLSISTTRLSKLALNFPCLKEQTKIANFLSSIDEKINHTATEIQQATQWKKGLLQTMFC